MRYNGLDRWRAGLLVLGVLVHASALYNEPASSSIYGAFILVSRLFRMEAFVMIAGFFAESAHGKTEHQLAKRTWQLALPLLSILTLIGLLSPIPGAPGLHEGGDLELHHLWFLPMLIGCAVIVAALRKGLILTRLITIFQVCRPYYVISAVLVSSVIIQIGSLAIQHFAVRAGLMSEGHNLGQTIVRTPYYLIYYLLGACFFHVRHDVQTKLTINSLLGPAFLAIAVLLYTVDPVLFFDSSKTLLQQIISNLIVPVVAVPMCYLIMTTGLHRYKSNSVVDMLSKASFSLYLLHYNIVMVGGNFLKESTASPLWQFFTITLLGLLVPLAMHQFFISRSPLLKIILNGVWPTRGTGWLQGQRAPDYVHQFAAK